MSDSSSCSYSAKRNTAYHTEMVAWAGRVAKKIGKRGGERGSKGAFAQRRQDRQHYLLRLDLVVVSQIPATSGARVSR